MKAGAHPKRPIPSMTAEAAVGAVVGYLNANPDVLGGLKRKGKRNHLLELRREVTKSWGAVKFKLRPGAKSSDGEEVPPHYTYVTFVRDVHVEEAKRLISLVESGDRRADTVLRNIMAGLNRRGIPLPPVLRPYSARTQRMGFPRGKEGRHEGDNLLRNRCIGELVEMVIGFGFLPSRNKEPANQKDDPTACAVSIVEVALMKKGIYLSEDTIIRAWKSTTKEPVKKHKT